MFVTFNTQYNVSQKNIDMVMTDHHTKLYLPNYNESSVIIIKLKTQCRFGVDLMFLFFILHIPGLNGSCSFYKSIKLHKISEPYIKWLSHLQVLIVNKLLLLIIQLIIHQLFTNTITTTEVTKLQMRQEE